MRRILHYFMRGLLYTAPLVITIYLVFTGIRWMDSLLPFDIPGIGFLIILSAVTIIGYVGTYLFANPFFIFIEDLIERAPLVKVIYTSIRDLIGAFVGEKNRFRQPVKVLVNKEAQLYKLGFITREDLEFLGITGMVAVYLPHSYNFSGNLFLAPKENVTPLHTSGTETMKFIVSAGITTIDEK